MYLPTLRRCFYCIRGRLLERLAKNRRLHPKGKGHLEIRFFMSRLLAPLANGPRDVSLCGALSLLQKYPPRGDSAEFSPPLKHNFWDEVAAWLPAWCEPPPPPHLEHLSQSKTAIGPLQISLR
jgi:hypothetical protein